MHRLLAGVVLAGLVAACAPAWRDTAQPMTTVEELDLARYAGLWHEVARFPVPFQTGCVDSTATYALRDDGTLSVTNRCRMERPDGPLRSISGSARPVGPGRLAVQLGWLPFRAPYHVLWVAEDYGTAVVGVPSGRAGWILHRSPDISPDRMAEAVAVLEASSYDSRRLIRRDGTAFDHHGTARDG